jgi:tripartite-type tricarboxylate transporter receptor subunit TctC
MTFAPDVPTFAEAGVGDMVVGTWNVVMAPRGTPGPIVEKLNAALDRVLREDVIRRRLDGYGITPVSDSTPASTAAHIESEISRWGKAFKISGAQQQ